MACDCVCAFFGFRFFSFAQNGRSLNYFATQHFVCEICKEKQSDVNASFVWSASIALLRHKTRQERKEEHSLWRGLAPNLIRCKFKIEFAFQHPVENLSVSCKVAFCVVFFSFVCSFRFCCLCQKCETILKYAHLPLLFSHSTRLFLIGSYAIVTITSLDIVWNHFQF